MTPRSPEPTASRASRVCFVQTLALLIAGVAPLPAGWTWARSALDSARSTHLSKADLERGGGGYYEGLIGHGEDLQANNTGLARRLTGAAVDQGRFRAANVVRQLPDTDFLQFELKPDVNVRLFGHDFSTNQHGMRDRYHPVEKPEDVYRIALLGSSIDMGWGVGDDATYADLLEGWLNAQAAARSSGRRFEVLNFAVAAYGPLHRLETYRAKARGFAPDLVLFSATMLDTRLMELHLGDVFRSRGPLPYGFLRDAVNQAGLTAADVAVTPDGRLVDKDRFKSKLRPRYWSIYDAALGTLAADCRGDGVELIALAVPRVGKADSPGSREPTLARLKGIAAHHAIPLYDLTATFDGIDPTTLEIAPWDDHPNVQGHRRLFLALTRAWLADPAMMARLFPSEGNDQP
ncbi:MAG: SGNH/GDSL hydrolase family protein [Isosphaeraceae bacterium]